MDEDRAGVLMTRIMLAIAWAAVLAVLIAGIIYAAAMAPRNPPGPAPSPGAASLREVTHGPARAHG